MKKYNKNTIIIIALIMSCVLYFAGVFSGLFATHILDEKTQVDLQQIRSDTRSDLERVETRAGQQLVRLNEYITFLERNVNGVQLEQMFLESLSAEQRCAVSHLTMEQMNENLQFYREQLPFRLEEYEKNTVLSEEYIFLKEQYNSLSIRNWVLMRNLYITCDTREIPGLYFYSSTCENCIQQGEELDKLNSLMYENDRYLVLFTIDANDNDMMIQFLLDYYNITQIPAIIFDEKVHQGRVFTDQELVSDLDILGEAQ